MDHTSEPTGIPERFSMGCVAVMFGLLAFWIAWIVAMCLDEHGWFDFVVRLVLGEVVLAVGLLSLAMLFGAVFAPSRMDRIVYVVGGNAVRAAALFFVVLIAPWILFVVAYGALSAFGLVR